jgi:uncharacterized membrane protein
MDLEKKILEVKYRWEYLKLLENNILFTPPTDRLHILLPMYIDTLKMQIEEAPFDLSIMNELHDKLYDARNRLKQINISIIA